MSQDIDAAMRGWEYKPGMVQARMVEATDGRSLIQLRLDLGILQLETEGRPDGHRPSGFPTYFAYLQQQCDAAAGDGKFVLDDEQCMEADREFVQYYHRRICWLALRQFERAVADSDHTLAFMDFVREHSPSEEYTQAHEQYRGFVLFQRTQAAAAAAMERADPEAAVNAIRTGLDQLRDFFTAHDLAEQMEDDAMVDQLRKMEKSLREKHQIGETLEEQLARAVANEEYEMAARLRDQMRRRQ